MHQKVKRTPILTIIGGHEPKEVAIGALHSSPFTIQLESLIELSREELSEIEASEDYHD